VVTGEMEHTACYVMGSSGAPAEAAKISL